MAKDGVITVGKYIVCVYAICKNEEQFVDRWMDAVSEADLVVVADTGSTDRTVERLQARGAQVYRIRIEPWRFDTARNVSLSYVPQNADICVCNDLDEVFEPGWRSKLEAAWQPQHTRARYRFNFALDENGRPVRQFDMEKIHRRRGFRWVHPVHEVLQYSGNDPDQSVWVDMTLNHYPDSQKSRGQYLPLLRLSAKENPQDDRTAFWLGREYLYNARYDETIAELTRHLLLPSAVWPEERSASMRYIAAAYEAKKKTNLAYRWLFRAIAECPDAREPYYDMLRFCYRHSDWTLGALMAEAALRITQKSGSYLNDPDAWGVGMYDLGAIACYHAGLLNKALEYAAAACKLRPTDARLQTNLLLIAAKIKRPQEQSVTSADRPQCKKEMDRCESL